MFLITLKQVSILLLYILLGYFLCRKKIITKDTGRGLSKLLVLVFTPAYTVPTLAKWLDTDYIIKYIAIILGGTVVCLAVIFLAFIPARVLAKNSFEKNIYKYLFAFSNVGYFGYPLIRSVYGEEMLSYFMLFVLPINLMINSYGYFILTVDPEDTEKISMSKRLKKIFSVPFLSSIIGIVLGLCPFTLPDIFYEILSPAGGCYSVSAMLIAGTALSAYSFRELFLSFKAYFVGLIRLIVIPVAVGGVAFVLYKIFDFDSIIFICTVAFTSLPAGMNVVVFPESCGKDGSLGAKSCFISYIMALATVPLWFYLLSVLV